MFVNCESVYFLKRSYEIVTKTNRRHRNKEPLHQQLVLKSRKHRAMNTHAHTHDAKYQKIEGKHETHTQTQTRKTFRHFHFYGIFLSTQHEIREK